MAQALFDGMADVFAGTFGEDIEYKSLGSDEVKTIQGIWLERTLGSAVDGEGGAIDIRETELHVRLSEVPNPQEGDLARRVSSGVTAKIVPPFRPDDKGMIALPLERDDTPRSTL
jgi:hypothetical protein